MIVDYDVAGLGAAFTLASAELGFASAAWLFIDEVRAVSGEAGVRRLQVETITPRLSRPLRAPHPPWP